MGVKIGESKQVEMFIYIASALGRWIFMCMENLCLLDIPFQIIEKYEGKAKGNKLLPVPSNQKCNDYLKEIAGVCGIK